MHAVPVRGFGFWTLTFLVVANMLGAGVFTTSGFTLASLGEPSRVLWAWLVGGLVALCGAFSYGLLVKRHPVSGGEYAFLSRAVHPSIGFVAGWVSLLAGFSGAIAFAALSFESYCRPEWIPPRAAKRPRTRAWRGAAAVTRSSRMRLTMDSLKEAWLR